MERELPKKHLFLMLAVLAAGILMTATVAFADGFSVVKYSSRISVTKGDYYAINMGTKTKNAKTVTVKSSKASVADAFMSGSTVMFDAKKAGKATLTITVTAKNGKKKTYKCKVVIYNYTNPVKSFKVGNTQFASKFKRPNVGELYTGAKKAKVTVTPKAGWKLKKIEHVMISFSDGMKESTKKVKNKSTISINGGYEIEEIVCTFYNPSKKLYEYSTVMIWRM